MSLKILLLKLLNNRAVTKYALREKTAAEFEIPKGVNLNRTRPSVWSMDGGK